MRVQAPLSSYAAKGGRGGAGEHLWPKLAAEVAGLTSLAELDVWRTTFLLERQASTPPVYIAALWEALEAREVELHAEARVRGITRTLNNRFADRMADDRA